MVPKRALERALELSVANSCCVSNKVETTNSTFSFLYPFLCHRKKLYMADVESAVLYTLRVEAARFLHLDKERLSTLKQYVALLVKCRIQAVLQAQASRVGVRLYIGWGSLWIPVINPGFLSLYILYQYFPGRPVVMNYLRNLNWWLQPMTNVSQSEWEEALRNKKELPNARLPDSPTWVGCQGSKPRYRGYPCALWTLFHLLTVQEALHNPKYASPSEVLPTMRAYVQYFFGCRECADHFEGMAAESMRNVKNKNEAVLWLWSRHNRVNARLAGTSSDDPKFPKIQWPPQDLCWSCQLTINGRRMWDERAILRFFKFHFSRANIYLDFLKPERENLVRNGRDVEDQNQQTEGKLEGGGGGENGQGVEEKLKNGRVDKPGLARTSSQELHKPSIVKMSTKTKEPEEDIVDLDTFSEQHYRSKALKAAGQGNLRLQRNRREIGMVLMEDEGLQALDYDAAWEHLKHKGLGDQQFIGAMKEGEKEDGLFLRRNQWLHILGVGFSRLDVSLCVVLYFLSSMCLLGMYTFFRMRMRYRKGRPGYPLA
ncbi:hypothetical protein lerEdw1_002546 [Lerista edwardsae]|nr:hypothetical protein lerEdw1_002546 [Lerista edwardsae]